MSLAHSVLRDWTFFFDEIWTEEHCVFSRMDVFFTKYGNERGDFSVKIGKKGHPINFFDP